jgi:rhodanese-related sulfurtransferase
MRVTVIATVALAVLLLGAKPAAIPDAPVNFIDVDELKSLLDRGEKADIIDVRRHDAYARQHIKGARSIPLQTFPGAAAQIPKTGLVVFYCTCPHAMSQAASNIVYQMGWRNQRVLYEGLPGWIAKGYAIDGSDPDIEPEH